MKAHPVAYCGLYCPGCYKNRISGAAEVLFAELEDAQKKGAHFLQDRPNLGKELDYLIGLKCTDYCHAGGGKTSCQIRDCCKRKGAEGCWECSDYEFCSLLKEQFRSNIKEIREKGMPAFESEQEKLCHISACRSRK